MILPPLLTSLLLTGLKPRGRSLAALEPPPARARGGRVPKKVEPQWNAEAQRRARRPRGGLGGPERGAWRNPGDLQDGVSMDIRGFCLWGYGGGGGGGVSTVIAMTNLTSL